MDVLGAGPGQARRSQRFRIGLLLGYFFLVPAVCAGVAAGTVWFRGLTFENAFLPYWLTFMPALWATIYGPVIGSRIAIAIGYHWASMAARLVELALALATFIACIVISTMLNPSGWLAPTLGLGIFIVWGGIRFLMTLAGK